MRRRRPDRMIEAFMAVHREVFDPKALGLYGWDRAPIHPQTGARRAFVGPRDEPDTMDEGVLYLVMAENETTQAFLERHGLSKVRLIPAETQTRRGAQRS